MFWSYSNLFTKEFKIRSPLFWQKRLMHLSLTGQPTFANCYPNGRIYFVVIP